MRQGVFYKHCVHCTPCHMPFHPTPCSYRVAIVEPLEFHRVEDENRILETFPRTELCAAGRQPVEDWYVKAYYAGQREKLIQKAESEAEEQYQRELKREMQDPYDPRDTIPDYEQFERNQLDLDRDAGEYDEENIMADKEEFEAILAEDIMVDLAAENERPEYGE